MNSAAMILDASVAGVPANAPEAHRDLVNSAKAVRGRLGCRSSWMVLRRVGVMRFRWLRARFASAMLSAVWLSTQALYAALFDSLFLSAVSWSRCWWFGIG